MKRQLKAIFVFLIVHTINCARLKNNEVMNYLESYGYYQSRDAGSKISYKDLKHSLEQLQEYGHIQITGKIDESTLALIKKPRCGVPDILRGHKRYRRYNLLSTKWDRHHLTWNFNNANGNFYHETPKIRKLINDALNVWSRHSVLRFEEMYNPESADIVISFEAAYHPHIDTFDLGNSALAHGFNPGAGIGGDIHVRTDVNWDFDVMFDEEPSGDAISFFAVILHEIGHAIGLHHSHDPDAVMYASYTRATGVLSNDDIEGIQHIYGVPIGYHGMTTSRSPWINDANEDVEQSEIPDKCDTSYDAIALIRNELFIFKDIYMWRPYSNSDAIEIRKFWSLPEYVTHVDSVYENDDGLILFFFGRDIFAFSGMSLVSQYSLSHIGIDHPFEKIDAIFNWHVNQRTRTYIFSGDQYWRFDGDFVDRNYPKDIFRWWHDVYDIDTAFSDDDGLYFLKGTSYYVLNPSSMRIDRMNPLPVAEKFMRCPKRQKVIFGSRFAGGDADDVIDIGQRVEFLDEENIEKLDEIIPINRSSLYHVSFHYLLFSIFVAFLTISRVIL